MTCTQAVSGNVGLRSRFNIGCVGHAVNVAYTGYNQEPGFGYVTSLLGRRSHRISTIPRRFL